MNLFFKSTGGVPVDRTKKSGLVEEMTKILKESEEMIVAVPAEGTRSWVPKWKTGFYHIASGAKVPILIGFIDYKEKKVGFGPIIHPSGDFNHDMLMIQDFYEAKSPKYIDKYNTEIF